jgi:hypothetical protein
MIRGLVGFIYPIVGLVVTSQHHFLHRLEHLKPLASAVVGILLWPLVLLGVNLHIH